MDGHLDASECAAVLGASPFRGARPYRGCGASRAELQETISAGRSSSAPTGTASVSSRTSATAPVTWGAAAAVAIVIPEEAEAWERESIVFDAGQATENAMLAPWELGIGSCHASVYDESLATDLLGYPEGMRCDVLTSLGYPADPTIFERPPRDRRPPAEIRHNERYHA